MRVCSFLASPAVEVGTYCKRGGRILESGNAVNCLSEVCLNLS